MANHTRKARTTRPRQYDRAAVTKPILAQIALGGLVSDACKTAGISRETLNAWCREDPVLSDAYARAREQQAHALAEQVLAISHGDDELTQDREEAIAQKEDELIDAKDPKWRQKIAALEANLIQRDRLRVDSLKWYTSKIAPKLYGEQKSVDITSKGEKISGVVVLPSTGDE